MLANTRRGIKLVRENMLETRKARRVATMLSEYRRLSKRTDFRKMRAVNGAWKSFLHYQRDSEMTDGVMIPEPYKH